MRYCKRIALMLGLAFSLLTPASARAVPTDGYHYALEGRFGVVMTPDSGTKYRVLGNAEGGLHYDPHQGIMDLNLVFDNGTVTEFGKAQSFANASGTFTATWDNVLTRQINGEYYVFVPTGDGGGQGKVSLEFDSPNDQLDSELEYLVSPRAWIPNPTQHTYEDFGPISEWLYQRGLGTYGFLGTINSRGLQFSSWFLASNMMLNHLGVIQGEYELFSDIHMNLVSNNGGGTEVPEPGSLLLFSLGCIGAWSRKRLRSDN